MAQIDGNVSNRGREERVHSWSGTQRSVRREVADRQVKAATERSSSQRNVKMMEEKIKGLNAECRGSGFSN